jgi:hypothetical protein
MIWWKDKNGNGGRCDARCWSETSRYKNNKCGCICGGANHGQGKLIATQNTRAFAHTWVERKGNIVFWQVNQRVTFRAKKVYGTNADTK